MKTWTDATLRSHHWNHTGNSMSLCVLKRRPAGVNSFSHLWKHAASLNVICWNLQVINKCRWQRGANTGDDSIGLDIAWPHRTQQAFICWIYSFKWISDTACFVSECRLWWTFCNVLNTDESHLLTIHGWLLQRSWSLRGVGACRAQGLSLLSDRLYSSSASLCLLGEGVSWIWSRQVRKQCSKGSWEFQLSPAFFSLLPDGSQMFFKAAALSAFALSVFSPSVSFSFYIFCPPPSACPSSFLSLQGSHPSQKCLLHLVWS